MSTLDELVFYFLMAALRGLGRAGLEGMFEGGLGGVLLGLLGLILVTRGCVVDGMGIVGEPCPPWFCS